MWPVLKRIATAFCLSHAGPACADSTMRRKITAHCLSAKRRAAQDSTLACLYELLGPCLLMLLIRTSGSHVCMFTCFTNNNNKCVRNINRGVWETRPYYKLWQIHWNIEQGMRSSAISGSCPRNQRLEQIGSSVDAMWGWDPAEAKLSVHSPMQTSNASCAES